MKLAVLYNICGISSRNVDSYYIQAIRSILNQNFDDYKVIISSCLNSEETIKNLSREFGQSIFINIINDKVPVNVSFNHTILKIIENLGEAIAYVYVDSGCHLINNSNVLKDLYNLHISGPYGMTVGRTKTDTGFPVWLEIGSHDNDSEGFNTFFRKNGHYIIPIGKAVNHHFQLWDNSILKEYGRLWPDIFASQCSESVFSFINAAINKKWIIHSDVEIDHFTGLDIPSVGFSPSAWAQSGKPTYDHPFIIDSLFPRLTYGQEYGLGYEENRNILIHNPDKFDTNGYVLDSRLKDYIRTYLYLQLNEFDYRKINYQWV